MTVRARKQESAEERVTPLELFFDLIFVFAITQVTGRDLPHTQKPSSVQPRRSPMQAVDAFERARENVDFRRVLLTGAHTQVVLMTIEAGGEIGEEVHETTDQLLLFVEGSGETVLAGEASSVAPNDLVLVLAGALHNVRNSGEQPLKLITVYAPPEHAPGTVHRTKEEADAAEH